MKPLGMILYEKQWSLVLPQKSHMYMYHLAET